MITADNSAKLCKLSEKLSNASNVRFTNTFTDIDWPEAVSKEEWFTTPDLITLYHTDYWATLTVEEQKRLSFYEAVNFYSINVHGERALLQGVANCLYRGWPPEISRYLHHFIEEENRHMNMFGGFVSRYANGGYAEKKLPFQKEAKKSKGLKEFILFVEIIVFEEIVDIFNKRMAEDESLNPVSRRINYIHHLEETRHLGFGRQMVKQLFELYREGWTQEDLDYVQEHVIGYIRLTWKQYYNPKVYKDAGLVDPIVVADAAWNHEKSIEWRNTLSSKVIKFLTDLQVIKVDVCI